jgi:hypothetical protein
MERNFEHCPTLTSLKVAEREGNQQLVDYIVETNCKPCLQRPTKPLRTQEKVEFSDWHEVTDAFDPRLLGC